MKIYEIGTGYTPIPAQVAAATESVVEELTKAFIKQNIDCEIIDISTHTRAPHNLPIQEVKVWSIFIRSDVSLGLMHKMKRVVYSIALARYLKKLLKSTNEKVCLHFHNQYNLFFCLKLIPDKLRKKATIVYTNHNGMWSLPYEEVKDTLQKRYFQEIDSMKGADVVLALNSKMKKNIIDNLGIDEEKVKLISNGVNTDIYRPLDEKSVNDVKAKYGLKDKKIILQVGSVYENKGQSRSVELLAPLLKKDKDLVFAYVGGIVSQEYFEHVQATAKQLLVEEQVRYLGTASPGEEMNLLYNIADAVIFSSQYEGFPLVCIEAISAGKMVIVTDKVFFDLNTGYEIGGTAQQIESVITGLIEKTIVNNGRQEIIEKYSWDAIAEQHLKYFN